jgi:2-amino-4-hydroxy-6-hydroxymethyldihydropteridine diphosphokinase
MAHVFISLGSNLGDRLSFLRAAVKSIDQLPETTVTQASSVYETEPVGVENQPFFLNAVAECDTGLNPTTLLLRLRAIEEDLGRRTRVRWGPREIDLDLLYYDDLILESEGVSIPHPEIAHRRFVLMPLNEIAPDIVDPRSHETVRELLQRTEDPHGVHRTSFRLEE